MFKLEALFLSALLASSAVALTACDDDGGSKVNGDATFNPGGGTDTRREQPNTPDGGQETTDGGCPNKPAGCFCGAPTTQAQWLNRCTSSAALPVNLTVKPATAADIP